MVGRDYQTYLKYFDGYQLVTIRGEESGKYIDGEIVVVYVYAPTIPEDNPEFETGFTPGPTAEIIPPKTGVSSTDYSIYYVMILILSSVGFYQTLRKQN